MKTDRNKSAAFSGHREIKPSPQNSLFGEGADNSFTGLADGNETGYINGIKEKLKAAVGHLYDEGYRYFLCGMAEGFDLLAGETVLELRDTHPGIHLVAVIPFPKQAASFKKENKLIYERILSEASHSVTVCPSYSYDCFHKRNDYLVANSDALVCFFNGAKGGTEYTVKQAVRKGLMVTNLY